MTLTRKEILTAFANDEVVQVWYDKWFSSTLKEYVEAPHRDYRIKPKTILINGVECPPETPDGKFSVNVSFGKSDCYDCLYLHFNTEADARQVFDALVKPFGEQQ